MQHLPSKCSSSESTHTSRAEHARAPMSSSSSAPPFPFFFLFFLHLLLILLLPPCCTCCSRHLLLHAGAANSSSPSSLAGMLQVTHGANANANVTDGLRRYLARFGYYASSSAPDYDADGRLVVSLYQSTLGLPVTGRLDDRTLDLLATPRCGVPDLQHNAATTARFAFFDGQPRWARAPGHFLLTYAIVSTPPYQPLPLPRSAVRGAFRRAFARWARVIPVRFRETRDYNMADVRVGFLAGDHGDGEPFDGPLGVLGHAFSPPSGQLHLDAAERWAVLGADNNADAGAVDLESVATHEIGHVLGLAHSSAPDAVMYPSLKPRTRKAELTLDDVRGVQALYGSNPRFSLSSLSEPDTSSASAPAAAATRSPGGRTTTAIVLLLLLVAVAPLLLLC